MTRISGIEPEVWNSADDHSEFPFLFISHVYPIIEDIRLSSALNPIPEIAPTFPTKAATLDLHSFRISRSQTQR
jgi:hypothetical protein